MREFNQLSQAVGFGTSMLPFLRPNDQVIHQPVRPEAIRPGDVITFLGQGETLITHRVVKAFQFQGEMAFLTKGDNRLHCDTLTLKHQIVGKVISVSGRDLTRFRWRCAGRFVAWLSYAQAVLYLSLSRSRLNRLRHLMEKRGFLPRIQLLPWFWMFSSPLSWVSLCRARGNVGSMVKEMERRHIG